MNEIEALIARAEAELEKSSQGTNRVDNRPHFPMLILFNRGFEGSACHTIFSKVDRVWSQSLQHLVKYGYSVSDGKLAFFDPESGEARSEDEFLQAIDREQAADEIFESMKQLMIYNVIDTTCFDDIESFAAYYASAQPVKDLVRWQNKTMLIVLLNDSRSKSRMAEAIRKFLSEHNEYDSTLLISTRTRDNAMHEMSELHRIVADLFLISNNDAVSSDDDEDYKRRFNLLYDKSTFTLSYVSREKPIRKIALQIIDIILGKVSDDVKTAHKREVIDWQKLLGFENGQSDACEKYLASLRPEIEAHLDEYIESIPLRSVPGESVLHYTYKDFCKLSYSDVIAGFAEMYYKGVLFETIDISSCCEAFRQRVCEKVSAADLAELSDETLEAIFRSMGTVASHSELPLREYLRHEIEALIRSRLIFPQFREILAQLRENAGLVTEKITALQADYHRYLPMIDGLGTVYKVQAESYLNGSKGEETLRRICHPQNGPEEILEGVFSCFAGVVNENKELFELSFIDEWERRLGTSGDRIYSEISDELTGKSDDLIRLYGNLPLDKRLKVMMLHTFDGGTPTKLYSHLKTTFENDELVQYFNTGYDDALESLVLIACNGSNLLL